jgi:O-antigen ligase
MRRNKWLFIAIACYFALLLALMKIHSTGFMILGAGQVGGRRYFQQLECAVFPFLMVALLPGERLLLRLFVIQCLLAVTFVFAEVALAHMNGAMFYVLYFMDVPYDGLNFAAQRISGGIARLQSLNFFGSALLLLLFSRYDMESLVNRRGFIALPLFLGILGMGLLSGHRYLVYSTASILLFLGYIQRFFSVVRMVVLVALAVITLGFAYAFPQSLPRAAQRTLYILPGFDADPVVREDADSTFVGRKVIYQAAFEMLPEHKWVGRGFASLGAGDIPTTDVIEIHRDSGIFYNGLLGLLVNTGIPGTVLGLVILGVGTAVAFRIIRYLRRYGCDDTFSRMCAVLCAAWLSNTLSFLFLEGVPEAVMRSFALQAGVLMACEYNLQKRLRPRPVESSESTTEVVADTAPVAA